MLFIRIKLGYTSQSNNGAGIRVKVFAQTSPDAQNGFAELAPDDGR